MKTAAVILTCAVAAVMAQSPLPGLTQLWTCPAADQYDSPFCGPAIATGSTLRCPYSQTNDDSGCVDTPWYCDYNGNTGSLTFSNDYEVSTGKTYCQPTASQTSGRVRRAAGGAARRAATSEAGLSKRTKHDDGIVRVKARAEQRFHQAKKH